MKKNTNLCVDLKTIMQNDILLTQDKSYPGLLTRDGDDHYLFQEAMRERRPPRNLKLFDGKYVSMVRMHNGRYQCHLKTMDSDTDLENYAFNVYSEIVAALKFIV